MYTHPADLLRKKQTVIFTAHSKNTFFMRQHICKFVLDQKAVPLNPFMNFEYFLLDTVPRDIVRQGNNTYVQISDELWVFGIIADGVISEIKLAHKLGKPIRFFSLGKTLDSISEIKVQDLEYENDVQERVENILIYG